MYLHHLLDLLHLFLHEASDPPHLGACPSNLCPQLTCKMHKIEEFMQSPCSTEIECGYSAFREYVFLRYNRITQYLLALCEPLKPLKAFILDGELFKCIFRPLSDFIFTFEPLFAAFCQKSRQYPSFEVYFS